MKVYVFLGPTLPLEAARLELDAEYLPPVSQGDLYRVARTHPFAIGVIDGNFERVPAVHHKEILWALSRQIHVFGGASMGALRAAELSRFGMRGVGGVYQDYQTGLLEDDDEVAVAHGDESTGHKATSEAMVNIRATLRAAERSGAIHPDRRELLEDLAKSMFYPERTYSGLFAAARARGVPEAEITELRAFVASSRVDAKRADAVAVLRAIRACVEAGEQASPPAFSFVHTDSWEALIRGADDRPAPGSLFEPFEALAAEVRLLGDRGDAILAGALARAAARRLQRYEAVPAGNWAVSTGNHVDRDFQRSEAELEGLRGYLHDDRLLQLENELRACGLDTALMTRSREKQQTLARHGHGSPRFGDTGMDRSELLAWYFVERVGRPVPADMTAVAQRMGLPDVAALEVEAAREFLFRRFSGQ